MIQKVLTSLLAAAHIMTVGQAADLIMPPKVDNSTFGNIEQIHTTHVDFQMTLDFDLSVINGYATHTMAVLETTQIA